MDRRPPPPSPRPARSTARRAPRGSPYPFRAAAIDAGSNAIRLRAVIVTGARTVAPLESARAPVRLGREVFATGRLPAPAMEAALEALATFRLRLEALAIQGYRAVATSAIREAENGAEFLARVRERTGLEVDAIAPAEEARLVHLAVRDRIAMGRHVWLLGDLGGGSLEISLATGGGLLWTASRPLGAVRLAEAHPESPSALRHLRELIAHHLRGSMWPGGPALHGCIATGGGIDSLARLAAAPQDRKGVATLTLETLHDLVERLSAMSPSRRVRELGVPPDRADVILPAALVYIRLAELAGTQVLRVPGVGVPDGVLLDIRARLAGLGAPPHG